jgi:site-specific recombinase XerD
VSTRRTPFTRASRATAPYVGAEATPLPRARQAPSRPKHVRSGYVSARGDGRPATEKILRTRLAAAKRRANLPGATGALHILRHTFGSHLAMRGAPLKAVQELKGHEDIQTTMRYAHLAPSAHAEMPSVCSMSGATVGQQLPKT